MRGQDQQSRLFYELCAMVLSILRSPLAQIPLSSTSPSVSSSRRTETTTQISPAAFASLLLGISLALMLCGSVTFVIGFILMPWVLGLVMVLYVFGIVSNLSALGRAILYPAMPSPSPSPSLPPSRKEMPGQLLSKLPIM